MVDCVVAGGSAAEEVLRVGLSVPFVLAEVACDCEAEDLKKGRVRERDKRERRGKEIKRKEGCLLGLNHLVVRGCDGL